MISPWKSGWLNPSTMSCTGPIAIFASFPSSVVGSGARWSCLTVAWVGRCGGVRGCGGLRRGGRGGAAGRGQRLDGDVGDHDGDDDQRGGGESGFGGQQQGD